VENSDTKRIDDLKIELDKCKKAQWASPSLYMGVISVCAIVHYAVNEAHWMFLVGGIMGLSNSYVWTKFRRVYIDLVKVYEAEQKLIR